MSVTTSPLFLHRTDWVGAGSSQGEPSWTRSPSPLVVRALPAAVATAGVGLSTGWTGSTGGGREVQPARADVAAREAFTGVPLQGAATRLSAPAMVLPAGYGNPVAKQQPALGQYAFSGSCARRGSLPDNRDNIAMDRLGSAAALDSSADECPDRRPTDPFFYPTTIKPLTGLGLSLIEQTTPPKKPALDGAAGAGSLWDVPPARDPACAPLFVPAPLGPYVDQPDEMQILQQQNNSLARHIQELEHAKSLAAAQSTQALHRIRARQEHLKREAAQAVRRAKEMQEDPGPPPGAIRSYSSCLQAPEESEAPRGDGPRRGSGGAAAAAPEPRASQQGLLEPAWPSAPAGPSASEGRSSGAGLRAVVEPRAGPAAEPQPCGAEAWRSSLPSTARGLDQSHLSEGSGSEALAAVDAPSRRTPQQPRSGAEQAAAFPPLPGLDGLHVDNSAGQAPTRRLLGEGTGGCGGVMPARGAQRADAWAAPMPTSDAPSMDISTMASRILTAHQAPGRGPVALLPDGQPYVDALGNPLGPISGPDLPNIKDDPLPAPPFAELRGGSDVLSVSGERCSTVGAGTHSMIGSFQPESADANLQHEFMPTQGSVSARSTYVSHERVAPHAATYEGMHAPPQGSYLASGSIVQEQEQHFAHLPDALPGTSVWSNLAASGGVSHDDNGAADPLGNSGTPRLDGHAAGDVPGASVEVAVTPSSITTQTAGEGSQRASRRPDVKEAPAPKQGRRRVSEEAGAPVGKRHQSEQSEQLQVELEECLDTIKWCASSVTRESLQDVKNISKPAPVVREVLETVALILGQPETRWDRLKKLVAAKDFPEKVQKLNFQQSVGREQFRKLRERLGHHEFDEELIKSVSVPMVPLAAWCRAIGVHLSRTKFKGGPEIRPLAAAGAAAAPRQGRPPREAEEAAPAPGAPMTFEPDVAAMGPRELRRVRDLTISRAGVGQIAFPGETDCTGLDFGRVVRLEVGEVLVYPESGVKPPVGSGLNRPATVTMYQCYPPSRGKLLQDPGAQERYKRKIQQMTEEKEAKFIDYDCITGVWKFSVDHF